MKLSDIIYPIMKPTVGFAVTVYHKKIFFSSTHRIPKDRPVLLISNHPTAFLEPAIYAGVLDRPIHALIRGNLFQNGFAKTALESLHAIAIYRMRDGGVEGLRKNARTFQHCYDLLADYQQVLIMAEGFTRQQKRLAPLQKGAARLALGAAQGRKLDDLLVIPIGANFTYPNVSRTEVIIEVGEPIEIGSYLADYSADKKLAINRLTADMTTAMRRTIIHIEEKDDDALFEKVVQIARQQLSHSLWPSWDLKTDRFVLEKTLANHINVLSDDHKQSLMEKVVTYPKDINLRSDSGLINLILLIIGFPIWLLGYVYRLLPFEVVRRIVKNNVNQIEFISPVRFGLGLLSIIIWSLSFILIIGLSFDPKLIWIPLVMIVVIWISLIYEDIWIVVQHGINWNKLSDVEKSNALSFESKIKEIT